VNTVTKQPKTVAVYSLLNLFVHLAIKAYRLYLFVYLHSRATVFTNFKITIMSYNYDTVKTLLSDYQKGGMAERGLDTLRPNPQFGVLRFFQKQTEASRNAWLTNDFERKVGEQGGKQTIQRLVFQDPTGNIQVKQEVPTYDPPTGQSETLMRSVDYYNVSAKMRFTPTAVKDNVATQDQLFNTLMDAALRKMAVSVESILLPLLDAQKTQVFADGYGSTFNTGVDELEFTLPQWEKNRLFANMRTAFLNNQFNTDFSVVGSTNMNAALEVLSLRGAGNELNIQDQNIPENLFLANSITDDTGTDDFTGYACKQDFFALMPNVQKDWADSPFYAFPPGQDRDVLAADNIPYFGNASIMVMRELERADNSAINPLDAMSYAMTYTLWMRFAVANRHNPDLTTLPNPVVKFVGKNS